MSEQRSQQGEPLPGGADPSTLYVFWSEPEPPLDEEVRLALESAFPGMTWSEDLEASDEVVWGGAYRFPDVPSEVMLWAEERGEFSDSLLEEAGLGPLDLEAARRARWLLGVEMFLDPQDLLGSFQFQLRLLAQAAVPGLVAVWDDNALVVRPGRLVRDLSNSLTPPRASTLYAIHSVCGYGGTWLHTHGLTRTGLPELDMVAVPADNLREAYDLVDVVADTLLSGVAPDEDRMLGVGEGLVLRAVSLEEGLPAIPERFVGGSRDRSGEMADHAGDRLLLFDARTDGPPVRLLERFAEAGVVYKSQDETERQGALSRERWSTFGQLFAMHRESSWRFHVKVACPTREGGDKREHLWFEVLEMAPGRVRGRLMNDPLDVPGLKRGQAAWHSLSELTDWLIVTPAGEYDPEAAPALLADG